MANSARRSAPPAIELDSRAAASLKGEPTSIDSIGRPERRACVKLIRFRSGELAAVTLRAAECGRPVACYIREAALGAALHARRTPVNDTLIRELARLANELAALGGRANDLQLPIASEFDRALEALLMTIHSIE